ncbi:hypothetical protein B9X75_10975 [Acinetobacter pittii]|nr:hypothetical protein ACINWCA157_A0018 [Acinetobacter radioresistens WC-A-157]OTL27862.1 hypothetical protein B9X77_04050 [Acinetobacter pittii]OTL33507.1 hypothetical protein B9X75_10975 [Acinetobacter pittii]OTL86097.1 hypothetical protein B9X62_02805 [Acinetobacter pittii]OTM64941.1 hypothetical protein B9X99_16260 [Acinetobacter pittii]
MKLCGLEPVSLSIGTVWLASPFTASEYLESCNSPDTRISSLIYTDNSARGFPTYHFYQAIDVFPATPQLLCLSSVCGRITMAKCNTHAMVILPSLSPPATPSACKTLCH